MMKAKPWVVALAVTGAVFTSQAMAASWQDQLSSAATQLSEGSQSSSAGGNSGLSLGALSGLLNGGNQALSSGSMTNAAGILQYCVQNNIVDNNVSNVKDQLMGKLGLSSPQKQASTTDYQQGIMGLLNTGEGKQLNLKALGDTQMGKQVKTKACDLVLKQGKQFIS